MHNSEGNQVDNATYHYFAQTNKLHYISDSYGETQAGFDLMNQTNGNFAYDLIGNLVKDKAMQVSSMSWTAYHKREKVVKEDGTTITYRYDAMNNRIYKKVEGNGVTETTHYLRDGTGNTLAIYKNGELEELNIYGSSRIGTYNGKTEEGKRTLGNKRYELSNHLGNALVVITDNKIGIDNVGSDFIADAYIAMVVSERDYLAFGAVMHKRSYENEEYTYSFNGKELDPATGWQDYGFRDYNPVYKRFDMVDPLTKKYPELTPYQFASNTPIRAIDLDGAERLDVEIAYEPALDATEPSNDQSGKAKITISMDYVVVRNGAGAVTENIDPARFRQKYSKGNTTLYMTTLPTPTNKAVMLQGQDLLLAQKAESGDPVAKQQLRAKHMTYYAVAVEYNYTVHNYQSTTLADATSFIEQDVNGRGIIMEGINSNTFALANEFGTNGINGDINSFAVRAQKEFNADNTIGGISTNESGLPTNNSLNLIALNPNTTMTLSPTNRAVHEGGHNAAINHTHTTNQTGPYEYPQIGLQSNQAWNIYPTQENTESILNDNTNRQTIQD